MPKKSAAKKKALQPRKPPKKSSRCEFCGLGREEVHYLVCGPVVCICDQCVLLCVTILLEGVTLDDVIHVIAPHFGLDKKNTSLGEILADLLRSLRVERAARELKTQAALRTGH